jgi:diguanylate cyclase (GGDEF)-like protein
VAGVINVILDDAPEGGAIEASFGANHTDLKPIDRTITDGQTSFASAKVGTALGEDGGFLRVGLELKNREGTNRAGFDQRIQEALAHAQAEQHLLALLYLDLDGFKPVNDEHGHAAGDTLLLQVAQRLQRVLRPSDVLARLGGDEFAVVLNDAKDATAAQAVARKIVGSLGEVFDVDGKKIHIGGSVGVALAMNGQDTIQGLLQRADAALYQAKRAGRGRFEMAADA